MTITNDGATILKQMQVLHPAAKMVKSYGSVTLQLDPFMSNFEPYAVDSFMAVTLQYQTAVCGGSYGSYPPQNQ